MAPAPLLPLLKCTLQLTQRAGVTKGQLVTWLINKMSWGQKDSTGSKGSVGKVLGGPLRALGSCLENAECTEMAQGSPGGGGNPKGPLELGEMSWRVTGSGRSTTEATGFVGGSQGC